MIYLRNEKWLRYPIVGQGLAYNDSSFENNTIAPINEPDLFARETVHHIRCTRLVGDGDSNTIAKCRERISYGGRILKVECANHAVRRYGRAIQKLQEIQLVSQV
ncbi:uncharacterized protein TNCV_3886981 [Trichonephila clavipes]|nr:uncharacterized protein TNCV_3886981 [Trichonephila clavipes]